MTSKCIGLHRDALLAALMLFIFPLCRAQSASHIELFGGYNYAKTDGIDTGSGLFICPGLNCPLPYTYSSSGSNLNGWEATAAIPLAHRLSAVADATGAYGTSNSTSSLNLNGSNTLTGRQHLSTYLFGPQIVSHRRLAPFAQLLLGVAHKSDSVDLYSPPFPNKPVTVSTTYGLAVGGGLDFRLIRHLALRPIQFRLLITHFNSETQFQPTISTGLVLHL